MILKFDFQRDEVSFFLLLSHPTALSCIYRGCCGQIRQIVVVDKGVIQTIGVVMDGFFHDSHAALSSFGFGVGVASGSGFGFPFFL